MQLGSDVLKEEENGGQTRGLRETKGASYESEADDGRKAYSDEEGPAEANEGPADGYSLASLDPSYTKSVAVAARDRCK